MTDNELLLALTDLFDKKLKPIENRIDSIDKKVDATKQELITRMDDLEHEILNTCLGYTDEQDESIIKKLDNLQSTVNTATKLKTIDNEVYNLVNKRIDQLAERVDRLQKIS